jgi:hypothetical protein
MSKINEKTTFVIGSGFSVNLGMLTTEGFNIIIKHLLDLDQENYSPTTLYERFKRYESKNPADIKFDKIAKDDLINTLTILLDGDGAKTAKEAEDKKGERLKEYFKTYTNIIGTKANINALEFYFNNESLINYDLLAFKSIYLSLQKLQGTENVNIVNVLTVITKAIENGISIPTKEIFPDEKQKTIGVFYNDKCRLENALNFYKLIVYKITKHLLRMNATESNHSKITNYPKYYKFFKNLHKDFAGTETLENYKLAGNKEGYLSNMSFITFNWDPILPFFAMKVNWEINKLLDSQNLYHQIKKRIYIDFGIPIPAVKLYKDNYCEYIDAGFTTSESIVSYVNNLSKESISGKYKNLKFSSVFLKLVKLYGVHGFFNMRICPRCQNVFMVFTEDFSKFNLEKLYDIFLSDPIPSEYDIKEAAKHRILKKKYEIGKPDELDCPACRHNVYFHHSFLGIQTIIKFPQPHSVSKIYYDYADFYADVRHVISIGYSFPEDDIVENVFLKTMEITAKNKSKSDSASGLDFNSPNDDIRYKKLTYITYKNDAELQRRAWYSFNETQAYFEKKKDEKFLKELKNLGKIFKEKNIRFNFSGFPDILDKIEIKDIVKFKI